MLGKLLLLFVVVPLVELVLLLQIGELVGLWITIAIVIATGFAGAFLARLVGLRTLGRIRETLEAGRVPTTDLIDGVVVLVAGAMLLTPGVLTDATALFLLTPPGRALVRRYLRRRVERAVARGAVTIDVAAERTSPPPEGQREVPDADGKWLH